MYSMMQMTAFMLGIVREAHGRMDTLSSTKSHFTEQPNQCIQVPIHCSSLTPNIFNVELG
jgi:hypothetical protein